MIDEGPSLDALDELSTSPDVRDRAFAASTLALNSYAENHARVTAIYHRIRETASRHHADVRRRIVERTFDGPAFVAELRDTPLEARDHLVEEVLGIAYPELELCPAREVIGYSPSGVAEILFMLDHAELAAEKAFVDLGSGLGKVVLLVALLTGARAYGVEANPRLVSQARAAARALALDNACFIEGDLHTTALPVADVYYMFIPSPRAGDIAARLAPIAAERRILLFSERLDGTRLPWLRARDASSYWLEMYERSAQ